MSPAARILALGSLLVLALSFAPNFTPSRIRARLEAPRDPSFASDPRYRKFLEAVDRATPDSATVALLAPDAPDTAVELAAYALAPRRVVGPDLSADAQFLAVYRRGAAVAAPDGATALPGGFLRKK